MEILKTFLGGAGGAALVAGLFALIQWRLSRKAQKEDAAISRRTVDCAARGQEIGELKKTSDSLIVAMQTVMYDKIKEKAKAYLSRSWITVEEYEDLKRMHGVYHHELKGNGFLDDLMKDVDHLEKRVI